MNYRIVARATCSNCHSVVTELCINSALCTMCKTAKLGKYQKDMLRFAQDGQWHTLAKDSFTQKVAKSLINRGLIEVNEFNMFKLCKTS